MPDDQLVQQPSSSVLELHTDDLLPGPGNRPATPDSLADLLPSMEQHGQQQPGIVTPAGPEHPGKDFVLAGNRRVMCCRILGFKFKAIRVPGPITPLALIRIRLTENVIRRAMTPDEVVADLLAYIREAGCTQAEAAAALGLKPSYVSKLLAPSKRLIPDLHHLHQNTDLCRDALRIISAMPTPALQKELAEKVLARGRVKRDVIEAMAAELKGRLPRVPRQHRIQDGPAVLTVPGDWTAERLVEWLAGVHRKARRCVELKHPLQGLSGL